MPHPIKDFPSNGIDVRLTDDNGTPVDQPERREMIAELREQGFQVSELGEGVRIFIRPDNVHEAAQALQKFGATSGDVTGRPSNRNYQNVREPTAALQEAFRRIEGAPTPELQPKTRKLC